MAKQNSHGKPQVLLMPRMTQPQEMKTKAYVCGVETVNGNDAWALFKACGLGDVRAAQALVAKNRRLVNAQYAYRFPIHLAVFAGNCEIVQLLLDHGADPGQSTYTYDSWNKLLHYAQERGYRPIEISIRRAMQAKFKYDPEFDVLKEAIIARDVRKIGSILRKKPNLARASDALGNNGIHWSVITRQLNLIQRFVEHGTPIDAQRADGHTPVLLAVNGATDYWYRETRRRTHPSLRNTSVIVGSLLAQGANYTLSVAAAVGDQERIERLLAADADLARRLDSARVSPLSYAAGEGHLHIVRLLLEHGADPNLPEEAAPCGRALYDACCGNHLQIAELLLEYGANPNAGVDSCECCVTIGAIYNGSAAKPLEQLLRQHGAYTPPYRMSVRELMKAIRDNDEVTRHDEFLGNVLAKRHRALFDLFLNKKRKSAERISFQDDIPYPGSAAFVRDLLNRGADPNRADWLGNTYLHACAEHGHRSSAALLLDAGAKINARDIEFHGTPLATAVRAWCNETDPKRAERIGRMVEFLLKRGAATNLPDDEPWATPLSWATKCSREDIIELLKRYGAK